VTDSATLPTATRDASGLLRYDVETPPDLRGVLDATVERRPDALAAIDDHGAISYEGLRAEVRTLAGRLAARGIGAGDRVGLLAGNSIAFTAACWAVWDLGAILVPLNFRLTASDLAAQVVDSGPLLLLVGGTRRELGEAVVALTGVEAAFQEPGRAFLADEPLAPYAPAPLTGDTPLAILYTSGTTGRPKGVVISHANALQNSVTCIEVIGRRAEDVELIVAPQFNVTGLCSATIPVVRAGMSMVLMDAFDAARGVAAIREHGVTSVVGAPTLWWRLLDAAGDAGLPTLRLALYGGAPMPRALLDGMRAALPKARFGNGYGMTETCSMVCYVGDEDALERSESVGRPLPVTDLRILDPETDAETPPGEVGEVTVRGPQVAMGYWTADGIKPLVDDGGWLRTGDGARLVDGFVVLADRLKDVIKRAGESVFSIEVEEVLYQHPAVLEASVTGVPDPTMGERVLAVVVRKPGYDTDPETLRGHCRASLAGFKVPSFIVFRDELPRNAGGKVVKATLKEEFAARLVESGSQ
jgi:acyl-CoA synthetase (AMP-forming)/AMP-acid ligase II